MLNIKSKALKLFTGLMVAAFVLTAVNFASADTISFTSRVVRKGAPKTDVMTLQGALNSVLGSSLSTKLMVDGLYGRKTTSAIKSFQNWVNTQNGTKLDVDGIAGPMTLAKLIIAAAGTSMTDGTVSTGPLCPNGMTLASNCMSSTSNTNTGTQTGAVTAMLATNTPAAGTVIAGQALADLAHITFTGTGTVTSIVLNRGGVSDSSTLSNVYLYDGMTRLTDGYTFNNTGVLTMNNVNLMVNGTKTVAIKADISSSTTSYSVKITLVSFMVSGSTTATLANIIGNEMFVASGTGVLGTVNLATTSPSPSATSINAGSMNQTLWSNTINVGLHASWLSGLTVKQIGSAPSNALANAALYVDGVSVAQAMINANNQFVFALATPKNLTTGSHFVEVRADVVGGANRNFYISLEKAADLSIKDGQVQGGGVVSIAPTYLTSTLNNVNGGLVTVNNGTLTINQDPAFNNTTTLVSGATTTKLGAWKFASYGEDVKVTSLSFTPTFTNVAATAYVSGGTAATTQTITVTSTTGFYAGDTITAITAGVGTITSITSGTVMVVNFSSGLAAAAGAVTNTTTRNLANVGLYVNGGQVGSNATATSGSTLTFNNLGSNLTAYVGTPTTVELRGDVVSSNGTTLTAGTVKFDLLVGSSNAQGLSSSQLTSTSASGGQTLTIGNNVTFGATAGFSTSTKAPNTAGVKVGSFSISAGSAEGLTVTNVSVTLPSGSGNTMQPANQLTNLTVKDGSTVVGTPIGNPVITTSNSFSVSLTVPQGTSKTFDVYADFGSSAAGLTVTPSMTLTYRGNTSNLSTTSSIAAGSTTTANVAVIAAGSVTVNTGLSLSSRNVVSSSNFPIATYNFKSNGVAGAVIKDVTFTFPANTITSITMNGQTQGSISGTTATIYNVGSVVPATSDGVDVPVTVSLVCTGTANGCTANSPVTLNLLASTVTYNNGSTTVSVTPTSGTATTVNHYIYASVPSFAVDAVQKTGLTLGAENKIGEVTIAANAGGQIKVNNIAFNLATSGITSPVFSGARIADGNTSVPGYTIASGCTAVGACVMTLGTSPAGFAIAPGMSKTFSLYATVSGTPIASTVLSVSSSVTPGTTTWDDTVGGGTAQASTNIYNFPTGSYSIRQ